MMSAFACEEIDSYEYWLAVNLSIRCWHGEHSFYTLNFALAGLIIWGILGPGFVLILILKNRHRLEDPDIKTRFGFLLMGY